MCSAISRNPTLIAEGSQVLPATVRHLILDRDGVLNRESGDGSYVRTPQEFEWLPGALEALALLRRAGVRLTVVTNQAGVGRGIVSPPELAAVHTHMQAKAAAAGGALDAVLVCTHSPEAQCLCRKPAPGLVQTAIARSGIAAAETLLVGDDGRDLEAARRAGIAAALVRTGKGRRTEAQLSGTGLVAYDDLLQLARVLAAGEPRAGR
jgi:D-glycero-D-manno-heptose 1,7-bisphosphate phosphatase